MSSGKRPVAPPETSKRSRPAPSTARGKEAPRLRYRDHEHDPAWHRSAEHHSHQIHTKFTPTRSPRTSPTFRQRPLRRGTGESALRRQGAQGQRGIPMPISATRCIATRSRKASMTAFSCFGWPPKTGPSSHSRRTRVYPSPSSIRLSYSVVSFDPG